jgi:hypothetical protein
MNTYIKLQDFLVHTSASPSEAQRWIDSSTKEDGTILVAYNGMIMSIMPDELTITDEHEVTHTHEHSNLSSHPRCPECGCTTYIMVHSAHDGWIGTYTCSCGYRFGHMHTGAKIEHCLYCAGSEHTPDGSTCSYCKGMWS